MNQPTKPPLLPATGLAEQILPFLDKQSLMDLTRAVIDIPSPMGSEGELGAYLAQRFSDAGLEVTVQEVEPGRSNIIGRLRGTGGGPTLMYCGHMDTAWKGDEEGVAEMGAGYSTPSFVVDDEWIFGAGAYNMKSGMTTAIAAVETMAKSGVRLKGDVVMACVVGETCHTPVAGYHGARYRGCGYGGNHLVSHGVTADLAVIPEPTTTRVAFASGGYVYFELKILGNPGASYARGGEQLVVSKAVDALDKAIDLKARIAEWSIGYKASNTYRGDEATNVTVVALESGHPWRPTKNPPFARLYVEVDTMPGQHPQDVIVAFETMLDEARSADPELAVTCSVAQLSHGGEVPPDSFVVQATSEAHARVHGSPPEVTYEGWFADTAAFTRFGIPAICYGPGGRNSEGGSGYYPRSGEQVSINDLHDAAQVFIHLATEVCSMDRATYVAQHRPVSGAGTISY